MSASYHRVLRSIRYRFLELSRDNNLLYHEDHGIPSAVLTRGDATRADPASLYADIANPAMTARWWAMNRAWGDLYMACNVRRAAGYMQAHGNDRIYACACPAASPYQSQCISYRILPA